MRTALLAVLLALPPAARALPTRVQGWQIQNQTLTAVHVSSSNTGTYTVQSLVVVATFTAPSITVSTASFLMATCATCTITQLYVTNIAGLGAGISVSSSVAVTGNISAAAGVSATTGSFSQNVTAGSATITGAGGVGVTYGLTAASATISGSLTASSGTFNGANGVKVTYGVVAGSATLSGNLTASSATLTATGATQYSLATSSGINVLTGGVNAPFVTASSAVFSQTGNTNYSLQTSSGVNVAAGGVTAPWFSGSGAPLTTLNASNLSAGTVASARLTGVYSGVTGLGTQAQALNMGTQLVNSVVDPVSAQDAATKNYVDSNANALDFKAAARLATTAALPANSYSNGSSGVGATLTGLSLGQLSVDGTAPAVNDRVLVKNEATTANNGIYSVTTNAVGFLYVLTRTTDFNTAAEMADGVAIFVGSGTTNIGTGWVTTSSVTTVGTDPVTFVQFSGLGDVTAGSGLSKSGNTMSVDSSSVPVKSGNLIRNSEIDASSITKQGNNFNGASQLVQLDSNSGLTVSSVTHNLINGLNNITSTFTISRATLTITGIDGSGYSLNTSSGIKLSSGTLQTGASGICFNDGTCQTTKAASSSVGGSGTTNNTARWTSASNIGNGAFTDNGTTVTIPNSMAFVAASGSTITINGTSIGGYVSSTTAVSPQSFSGTTFRLGIATVTINCNGVDPVSLTMSLITQHDTAGDYCLFSFMMDGAIIDGRSNLEYMAQNATERTAQDPSMAFDVYKTTTVPSAGLHNFTLLGAVSEGNCSIKSTGGSFIPRSFFSARQPPSN